MLPHETTLLQQRKINLQSLPGAWIDEPKEDRSQEIDRLKQTIAHLRKEKQKLEETNDIVKKSIQIVARKRRIAQKKRHSDDSSQEEEEEEEEEEEDIYIVVPSDFMPSQEELNAAGLEGWEWISTY